MPPERRLVISCEECRRRKIRCDKRQPCGPCSARGEASICREAQKVRQDPTRITLAGVNTGLERLGDRVEELERELAILRAERAGAEQATQQHHHDVDVSISHESRGNTPSTSSHHDQNVEDSDAFSGMAEEMSTKVLEEFAQGWRENKDGEHYQPLNPDIDNHTTLFDHVTVAHAHQLRYNPSLRFFLIGSQPNNSWVRSIIDLLPTKEDTLALVRTFFDRVHWFTRVVHKPVFLKECQELLSFSKETATARVRLPFLSCHIMILCLALHFSDSTLRNQLALSPAAANELAQTLCEAAEAILWGSDFMATHRLGHLSCIVLMSVYRTNFQGQADQNWALLGTAVRISQRLGLPMLGRETDGSPTTPGPSERQWPFQWTNGARRETGRHVWWNLVWLDRTWSASPVNSSATALRHYTCVPPHNVDDGDLQSGDGTVVGHDLSIYTDNSFAIYRSRLTILLRDLPDTADQKSLPSYNVVREFDVKLKAFAQGLPPYFENPFGPLSEVPASSQRQAQRECIMLHILYEDQVQNLHRPYLFRAQKPAVSSLSRSTCIASAQRTIDLLRQAGRTHQDMLKLWPTHMCCFRSCLILFYDLLRSDAGSSKRGLLESAVQLLDIPSSVSPVARSTQFILRGLLGAEMDIRRQHKNVTSPEQSHADTLLATTHKLINEAKATAAPMTSEMPPSAPIALTPGYLGPSVSAQQLQPFQTSHANTLAPSATPADLSQLISQYSFLLDQSQWQWGGEASYEDPALTQYWDPTFDFESYLQADG